MTFDIEQVRARVQSLLPQFRDLLGHDRVSTAPSVCEQHGKGESFYRADAPDVVCFAKSTEEVAEIVKLCAEHTVPIIAFGAGTSLEGHTAALYGGVCIDLSAMNQVLSVQPSDLNCRVQAGVTRIQLNQNLRETGLFFPVDPGADASVGGMCATRASGTNAVRYGTMADNVLSLKVVTPQGEIIETGTQAKKSSAGYDLTHLYLGSEGTLGIITEVTLKLHGIPEAVSSAVVNFPSVGQAVDVVIEAIQYGMPIARVELLDATTLKAINAYCQTQYRERATLFVEFNGTDASVAEQIERFRELAEGYEAADYQWAQLEETRNQLWHARHNAYYAAVAQHPGKQGYTTDVCVPISQLGDMIAQAQAEFAQTGREVPILGHVGDGNFHCLFFIDPEDSDDVREVKALHHRLVERAIAAGGTCTGEHGVGQGKLDYVRKERGEGVVQLMQTIKQALDPQGIMNPGKTVPMA